MDQEDHFRELCRLRATLEVFAAGELFKKTHRGKIILELTELLEPMRRHARRKDYEAFHAADMLLHQTMVSAAGVPTLVESWQRATEAIESEILRVKKTYWPNLVALWHEHTFLVDAWASHDLQVVEQAPRQHLEVGLYRRELASGKVPPEGSAVDRAAAFFSTHYASEINVDWVAHNIAFISPSQLARQFQATFAQSPYAWLRQVRMERAALLLRTTDDDIAVVGQKTGYKNPSHFSRDFRACFHTSPRLWRKTHRH